jgi:hypothetical protein
MFAIAAISSAAHNNFVRSLLAKPVPVALRPYNTDAWREKLRIKDTDEQIAPRPASPTPVKSKTRKTMIIGTKTGHKSHTYANGAVYQGNWLNFLRHGIGRYEFPNGDVYQGEWAKDKPHGMGRFDYGADGSSYYGNWHEGRRQGTGKRVFPDGSQYEGEWIDDQIQGQGIFVAADGSRYEGEWLRGRRHGQGTLTSADGSVLHGVWADGALVSTSRSVDQA